MTETTPTSPTITFASLALAPQLQRALADKGYTEPSPIQAKAIPALLEGRDMIGIAQTGTGKTAAFALPLLHRLAAHPQARQPKYPRALILTPTRELAVQIADNLALYGRHLNLRHTLVFGGVGEHPQIRSIMAGVDIVVATPGRLLDLMEQRHVSLNKVEIFVLDEADRMLDMGFAPAVKRVLAALPPRRQSLLFSATMPEAIRSLANSFLNSPVRVEVAPVATTAERIDQHVCHVAKTDKHSLLLHLLKKHTEGLVLVFSRTKHGADRIARNLERDGIPADAIHGNKSQNARQRALEAFRTAACRVLVATDIAARGIDVKGVSLVINYDLPNEPESYVHRIGRTARAGADGMAISFCDETERAYLRDIQRLIRQTIPALSDHPFAVNGPRDLTHAPAGTTAHQPHAPRPQAPRPHGGQGHQPRRGPAAAPAAKPAPHPGSALWRKSSHPSRNRQFAR